MAYSKRSGARRTHEFDHPETPGAAGNGRASHDLAATPGITGAVVGRVVAVADHPRGDRIWLAEVDLGNGQPAAQIVFGGDRKVRTGDLVPVAPPGARVVSSSSGQPAQQKKMRRRRIRGEVSHGMLCSLHELGWLIDGPDEVAILRNTEPGDRLDELPVDRRPHVVVGWTQAVEKALTNLVDEVLESPQEDAPPVGN